MIRLQKITYKAYCPYCHKVCRHMEGSYWECQVCNYSITDDELEDGEGFYSYEDSFREDYGDGYSGELSMLIPDKCIECDGAYPKCVSRCKIK